MFRSFDVNLTIMKKLQLVLQLLGSEVIKIILGGVLSA